MHEFSRHHEKFVAKLWKCQRLPLFWETESFEPRDQIVGQKRQFGIQGIGGKISRGGTAKGKIIFEDADDSFKSCPVFVKSENAIGGDHQACDDDRVSIFIQSKEC